MSYPLLPNQGGPHLDPISQALLIGLPIFTGIFGGYFLVRVTIKNYKYLFSRKRLRSQ